MRPFPRTPGSAGLHAALDDLADATGRRPQDVVSEAVAAHLRAEEARVRAVAERLADAHAGLLERLGA
ncbi:hypothetical protein [Streptomyces galbus]|uniref:Uncharacterized protein n=1 Tax=Streptomyces galbus TaxID=33898 RepID=A0A4U5X076_STRGB|nr:hypothetical protein [Streptomyces galbus]TKT08335.1 hypothetical protein E4U92_17920 [Streptomyces galbus]GHD46520.1 hypothetical protein GCM10010335_53220 [Streptomyces galbus]